jgi:uracil-DNA glycosylase
LGTTFKLTENRGRLLDMPESLPAAQALATTHPSAVLRAPDRTEAFKAFAADLRVLAEALG